MEDLRPNTKKELPKPIMPMALAGVLGFVAGALCMGLLIWTLAPGMMLKTHASRYGLDETCQRLQAAITRHGWRCPAIRNMNEAMSKDGVSMERQVRIVELCKADYARDVLTTNPEVSTLMPCAFGVYQIEGKTYVTGMNTGLMGTLFGGVIAEVMGGKVARDEQEILKEIQ